MENMMTSKQIEALLERTYEAVERIARELGENSPDINDASAKELHKLGQQARELADRVRVLQGQIQKRYEVYSNAAGVEEALAETADSLADELEAIAVQLEDYQD